MRVMVTGATGFVGRHVVSRLLKNGHTVVAIARDNKRASEMSWFDQVEFIQCDLHKSFEQLFSTKNLPDALIHLAWPGLPDYGKYFHISENLPVDLLFLQFAVSVGVPQILVAGTCLEYGKQYGPLCEEDQTNPSTPYGFAKDTLRKALQMLSDEKPFIFQWVRLFYMYGEGQNSKSLLAQLDKAISAKESVFNMSAGDQLRDYLTIQEVAEGFSLVLENPQFQGIINCCSGKPISILDLVRKRCEERESRIQLNRWYYPYPAYESLAFWGVPSTLNILKNC